MPDYEFVIADPVTNREELIELNVEYLSWVFQGIEAAFSIPADQVVGMPAKTYVPAVIDKVCGDPPPKGIFYLVKIDGELAGMGGLRRLSDDTAEIKRIYFRPAFRGRRLGEIMLKRLLADAVKFSYNRVCLDTGPFMSSAQRLYEANGFVECNAYQGVEVPLEFHSRWRFMECKLQEQSSDV